MEHRIGDAELGHTDTAGLEIILSKVLQLLIMKYVVAVRIP